MQNPLESYRRTQRELRRQFDAFTRENCPTCPTPCCRRPARILPTDIMLAESTGWKGHIIPLEASPPTDMIAEVVVRMADALHDAPATAEAEQDAPSCEYLGEHGCTFPADLRPFGCTAYICKYMYERLDRPTLSRIKRLVRELEEKHTILLRTIRNVRWKEEE
jgi:hypothetical protein